MRVTSYLLLLPLFVAMARSDDDYSSFISSLSYNWQNEYSDLRFQVNQLQKNDPQQYQALVLALGLKPGVYSQRAVGVRREVGIEVCPAPNSEQTFDEAKATPTKGTDDSGNIVISVPTHSPTSSSDDGSDMESSEGTDSGDVSGSEGSKSASKKKKPASASGDSSADEESTPSSHKSKSSSVQYGNPVVSNLDFQTQGVRPTGTGYNAAALASTPFAAGTLALVALTVLF
ncbi:hypothetical protein DL89DRAFT_87903 [Linderina pennispora]|uniref:Uncharacterized protein n=1 Tax=Linderina pennispora TaxID=61395 RepID=A0A1Y1WHU0_9FUNG|nr:uncharacterized protein DL89DRAFT_87903 [Linderina pennispora]ORX73089.1 hypothetical protein DL89DRAFT_87903 [Linderina pennispora]